MPKKITFTELQLAELKAMLDHGIKQTDIAKHFHVTDDTIRKICHENGFEIRMPHKCVCVICGDVFYSNIKGAKTCKKEHHWNCVVCGKDFIVDRSEIRDTCSLKCYSLQRYGVDHPAKSKKSIDKRQATVKEKYGVDSVSQLPGHKEKSAESCLKKFGATSYAGSEEGKAAIRKTNLERYGVECLLGDSEYRKKIDQINLEKYGTIHPMQTEEIKSKQQSTMLERYGVDNIMKSEEGKDAFKQSLYNKYGYTSTFSMPQVKEKISNTCLEKFGVPWACMRPEARSYNARSKINRAFEQFLTENEMQFETEFPLEAFSFDFKCSDTLIEIDPTITHNSTMSIFPNVEPKSVTYHSEKTKVAQQHGYRCIHVFDWDSWRDIIKLLKPRNRIFARNCDLKEISVEEASRFINANHIQKQCRGTETSLGLFHKGELVEVMTFGKPRYNKNYDIELLRLCSRTDTEVTGGASKLFKYYIRCNPNISIISYCDLAKFSGRVYETLRMKLEHQTPPAKIWSKDTQHITDNLLRQRGFDQLFNTNFGKGTSNEELMINDGWLPVYDCGQLVFAYRNNK